LREEKNKDGGTEAPALDKDNLIAILNTKFRF
jgi:hypothetical protein